MNRNRKGISHARALEHCRCAASCHLTWRQRSEARKGEARSIIMHHFQNGGITPLCIPLSSLLFSRQRRARRRVIVHAWIAVVMRGKISRTRSRIDFYSEFGSLNKAENMSRLSLTIRRPMSWDESLAMGRLGSLTKVPRQRKEGGSREERNKGREI